MKDSKESKDIDPKDDETDIKWFLIKLIIIFATIFIIGGLFGNIVVIQGGNIGKLLGEITVHSETD